MKQPQEKSLMTYATHDRSDTEKPPRTRSKEERKQQLIDATIKSIAQYGLSGTTMTTVTSIAGLSIGLVNFHFESKQKLFEETLLYLALEHQEAWKSLLEKGGLSIEESILAIVDSHFDPKVSSREREAAWFAFLGDSKSRAAYRRIVEDIDDALCDRLEALITELVANGDFPHVVPKDVTTALEALLDGLSLTRLLYPTDASRADARRLARDYLKAMFPGHFLAPPTSA